MKRHDIYIGEKLYVAAVLPSNAQRIAIGLAAEEEKIVTVKERGGAVVARYRLKESA